MPNDLSRRQFLQTGAAMAAAPASRRPNILYVFSDMQPASSLGCYGDPNVRTPSLDAFAAQGARLDAAMSVSPVCGPHRAALMTALYGHHSGVVSNDVQFTRRVRGMGEQFRDAGYTTGYAGSWGLPPVEGADRSMPLGFPAAEIARRDKKTEGHYVKVDGREVWGPTVLADRAIQFIERNSAGAAPWLFCLSWNPPHVPYAAPPELRSHYAGNLRLRPNVPAGAPTDFARSVLPDYYGMVESLDIEFQRVLSALDRAGAVQDTIVCYSSDHGDMLGCHGYKAKRWPHEESARVPLLIRYPRAIPAGRIVRHPLSTVDVYPTLAGLAGLAAPAGLDGADYSPVITGQASRAPRGFAFLQMMYAYVPWPGWRALRTQEYSYARTGQGPWLLFNMEKDPYQLKNLVDDPGSRTLVRDMDQRLAAFMKETGDSWEYKATNGDLEQWVPGGQKQKKTLGVPWPGVRVNAAA